MPILAELHRSEGSRFVPLANRLGLSRESLRQTLLALIETGLVMRNPGYGHPMRPEYVLTAVGRRIAPGCVELVETLQRLDFEAGGLKKWSIPVLLELAPERRFAELREALGISPRALTLSLKELAEAGLVERRVHSGFPPSTSYRVTRRARSLTRVASQLDV